MGMWTVFILYENLIFARGLESALNEKCGVTLLGLGEKGETPRAQLLTLEPDIVIVEGKMEDPESGLLLCDLLQQNSPARVIEVSVEEDAATFFFGGHRKVNDLEDLIRGIFEKPVSFV